jgi:hypothetical protein
VLVLDAGHALASGSADEVIQSLPGTVSVVDHPDNPERAWRRGRVYHQWDPAGRAAADSDIDLEDAVIGEMLQRREQERAQAPG